MLNRKPDPPRGVLHVGGAEVVSGLERFEPGPALRPFVEHYWAVTWDRQPRTTAETVPHPSVHLVLEPGQSKLHGVYRRRFTREIEGSGRVSGVKFRPGGFRAFAGGSVARFTGTVVPPATVFGPAVLDLETATAARATAAAGFELIDAFLTDLRPMATAELDVVTRVVQTVVGDVTVTRSESLAERFGLGPRQLQRLFREYVGVSPKWVIRRYRLIEAAERLRARAATIDFAVLAADLGYADQAHFIRDFKGLVGQTPARYLRSLQ